MFMVIKLATESIIQKELEPLEVKKEEEIAFELIKCECGSKNIIWDNQRGEVICGECGLVLKDHLIQNCSDKRFYNKEESDARQHNGSPPSNLVPDKGLGTTFYFPKNLNSKKTQNYLKLRRLQNRQTWSDKHLYLAIGEIKRITSILLLPKNIAEAAATLYRKIYNNGILRSRSIKCLATASLYITCRMRKIPVTLKMIADTSPFSEKKIRNAYFLILKELNINLNVISSENLIPRIDSQLNISNKAEWDAIIIAKKADESKEFLGKNHKGIAAAAVYIATAQNGEKVGQRKIAKAAEVTQVTLRKRYKEIVKKLGM